MEKVQLTVQGMSCMGCVGNVKTVLEAVPGVTSVEVVLEDGKTTIVYDPALATLEQFKTAIFDAGFDVA